MSINILSELEQLEKEQKSFKTAILLTYSLNLHFFEQLVQPKLDALGCTQALILSDIFGYEESLQRNLHNLKSVGRRYVCAPILTEGFGIQHGKFLLLLSETRGWLLVGSGNLTLSGYGQNLELFDVFEFDSQENISTRHIFQSIWQVIDSLKTQLPKIGQDFISQISQQVQWLRQVSSTRAEVDLWNSIDEPIINSIRNISQKPVDELHLIAPFIHLNAVESLIRILQPSKVVFGVNNLKPNIDGEGIARIQDDWGLQVEVRAINASQESIRRGLHAKAIIGITSDGSWCIVGSANLTRPALLDAWTGNGNLEIVVYRPSDNPDDFLGLWESNTIQYSLLELDELEGSEDEVDSSPENTYHIRLANVSYRDQILQGILELDREITIRIALYFVVANTSIELDLNANGAFAVELDDTLSGTEAVYVVVDDTTGSTHKSQTLFVDQPRELEKYGARSFHFGMRSKLESVSGAANTFKELMNYLFERKGQTAHENNSEQPISNRISTRRATENSEDTDVTLSPAAFITDEELNFEIGRRIDVLTPYVRDYYSLRDLLSLVLLRITTETVPQRIKETSIDDVEDEDQIAVELETKQNDRLEWQRSLISYVSSYVKRYSRRLKDLAFWDELESQIIYQNHGTLCYVILEFHEKSELFDYTLLRNMCQQLWEPFFDACNELETITPLKSTTDWVNDRLLELLVQMLVRGWNEPLPDMRSPMSVVYRFMYARHLIGLASRHVGEEFWFKLDLDDAEIKQFQKLATFKTPHERKFELVEQYVELKLRGLDQTAHAQELLKEIDVDYIELVTRARKVQKVLGNSRYCPESYLELPQIQLQELARGHLVESQHARGVLLYHVPQLDLSKFSL